MAGFANNDDYLVDQNLENQRFLITEKKMQMIQLQAKIDALGAFNSKFNKKLKILIYIPKLILLCFLLVNLKDLDEYNNAAKFEEKRKEFDIDLHQNLELWDNLMKVTFFFQAKLFFIILNSIFISITEY